MSGVIASFPYNIMAFLVFMGALAYLWFNAKRGKREAKKTEELRKSELVEAINEAVKTGVKEAIIEIKADREKARATKNE